MIINYLNLPFETQKRSRRLKLIPTNTEKILYLECRLNIQLDFKPSPPFSYIPQYCGEHVLEKKENNILDRGVNHTFYSMHGPLEAGMENHPSILASRIQ